MEFVIIGLYIFFLSFILLYALTELNLTFAYLRDKRKNRGVKQAGFWVLHNTYMPSILIETGFITNKSEGDYLNSQKGKISISKSISDAILNYKSKLNSDPLLETKALPNKLVEETEQKNKNISVAEIQPNSSKLIFKV